MDLSRAIDISLPIGPDLLVYPRNPAPEVLPWQRLARGDSANVSELRLGTHTGTHIDPPLHFLDGAPGVDTVDLGVLMGPAEVVDLRGRPGPISAADLAGVVPEGAERVLMRTDNSELWRKLPVAFPDRYVALGPDGARWCVERGIRLIGTDFLGIEQRGAEGHPVHRALLGGGVIILEGLDLSSVEPGHYTLVVLPLRLVGGDGGPARAVLLPPS